MAEKKGNRSNVMNRWYGRDKDGLRHQTPRRPFKGEPQYTLDQLFITPFTHAFTADDMGRTGYTPVERNLTPSGIHILDAYLQALHRGHSDIADFCDRYNARTSDLDGLIFLRLSEFPQNTLKSILRGLPEDLQNKVWMHFYNEKLF